MSRKPYPVQPVKKADPWQSFPVSPISKPIPVERTPEEKQYDRLTQEPRSK